MSHQPNAVTVTQTPVLNRHFRFQWEASQNAYVLLYPEGMVQLNGPAGEILSLVDGDKNIAAIVAELESKFPDAQGIDADVCEFIAHALEQNWISLS